MAEKDDTKVINSGSGGVSLQLIRNKKKKKKTSSTWVVEHDTQQPPESNQGITEQPVLVIPLPKKTQKDGPLLLQSSKSISKQDEEAIKALINDADPNGTKKNDNNLIIDSKNHKNTVPGSSSNAGAKDMNVESDYTKVSISDFGAAMLRGMGWTGSTTSTTSLKEEDVKSRPARLGLGATPLIAGGKKKKNQKKKLMTTQKSAVYKTLVEEESPIELTKAEIQKQIQQQMMENQEKLQKYSFITYDENNCFAIVMETQGIPGLNQIAIQPLLHDDNDHKSPSIIHTSRSNVSLIPFTKLTPSQHSLIQSIHSDPSFYQQSSEKEEEINGKGLPNTDEEVKQQQQQNQNDKNIHERKKHAVTKRYVQQHNDDIYHRNHDGGGNSSRSSSEERYRKRRKKHKKERRKYYSDDSKDDTRRHGRNHSRRRRREYDYSDDSDDSRRRQTRKTDKKRRKERHSKNDDESKKINQNKNNNNWRLIPYMGVKMIELKQYAKVLNVVRRSSSINQLYATCQLLNSTKTTIKKVLQEDLRPMVPTSIGEVIISISDDSTTTIGTIIEVSNQSAIVQCSEGIIQSFPTSSLATYYGPINHDE